MRKARIILSAFLAAFGLAACAQRTVSTGSGWFGKTTVKASKTYVTKDIRVKDFTDVEVTGSIDVEYTQKPGRPTVLVYTSDNIVNLLDVYVKDGTLHLGFKKNYRITYDKLQVRISSEALGKVWVTGSGSFSMPGEVKTGNVGLYVTGSGDIMAHRLVCNGLKAHVAGSGDISGQEIVCASMEGSVTGSGDVSFGNLLVAQTVDVKIAGSGTFKINGGEAGQAGYSITGSGDILAAGLKASRVDTQISGSGDIECHAVDFLKVRVTGSGDVGYKGDPELDVPRRNYHKL